MPQEASAKPKFPSMSDAEPFKQTKSWEQVVEEGKESNVESVAKNDEEGDVDGTNGPSRRDTRIPSVIFLLHSGQPLSYLSSLISAEEFQSSPATYSARETQGVDHPSQHPASSCTSESSGLPAGSQRITFHSGSYPNPGPPPKNRWSPATGLGDFLRSAARAGSFTVCINDRRICVRVPSFSSRTRFLRGTLHRKTIEIEHLAKIKAECDLVAKKSSQRIAVSGAGVLAVWWLTVGYLTFRKAIFLCKDNTDFDLRQTPNSAGTPWNL
jgi:hypothetical protein